MDTGNGTFRRLTVDQAKGLRQALAEAGYDALGRTEETSGVFAVGEEVEMKGSRFVIQRITKKTLVLGLLPRSRQGGSDEQP